MRGQSAHHPFPLRARAGRGITVRELRSGASVSAAVRARRWLHPWETTVAWAATSKRWVATVEPGFVNHRCPVYRATVSELQREGQDFGINPLTGERYFSADVFSTEEAIAPGTSEIDVPLYFAPPIELRWRNPLAIPQFFVDRDVSEGADRGLRLLKACDLILHQPRVALTSEVTIEPGIATGISIATQRLGLRAPDRSDALRVVAGTFVPLDSGIDPLFALDGLYEERTWDELLIATVFLVSPPGVDDNAEPNGSWQPFVRHGLFWNLNYAVPNLRIFGGDPQIGFIPPLAFGVASPVTNILTASINDMLAAAFNIVSAHSMTGVFWTATGGGHDAEMPAPEPAAARGLNKLARLEVARREAALRRQQRRLDPPFPFRAVPFDPALLTP